MKNQRIIQGVVAGMLVTGFALSAADAVAAAGDSEKCAGIAKAGKNDCGTSVSSCAGTAKTDRHAEAWILVPKGTCEKIAGGRIQTSQYAKHGGKGGA